MYQNGYNYYPNPMTQNPYYPRYNNMQPIQPQPSLKGRPVSSLEEVRATGIDFDGSVFYFPDLANRRIYTKQINLDGTASLNLYELKSTPPPTAVTEAQPSETTSYVKQEDFERTITALINEINQLKGVKSDEQSNEPISDASEFKF